MKLERLLAIVMLLINRGRVTAGELAEHFEVSVRTIYRDLDTIGQAGIPIVAYQGANGGYGIMETYKVDKNVLTPDEMLSIITALKGVNTTLNDRKYRDIEEKIKSLIPVQSTLEKGRFAERIVVDFSGWGNNSRIRQKAEILRKAIEENRVVTFLYTTAKGTALQREVEPMILILKGYAWYLEGFCRLRNDYRLFRFSRMRDLTLGEETFQWREHTFEGFRDTAELPRPPVSMVLHFSHKARVRAEDLFEEEETEVLADSSLLVRVTYPEDDWVYGTILSFGPEVEVLEPAHLREIICDRCKKTLEMYGQKC